MALQPVATELEAVASAQVQASILVYSKLVLEEACQRKLVTLEVPWASRSVLETHVVSLIILAPFTGFESGLKGFQMQSPSKSPMVQRSELSVAYY